jgi:hypothetical protein
LLGLNARAAFVKEQGNRSAKVQIGEELRCKGGKVNDGEKITECRVRSTEYGFGRTEERQVQRCKSEQSSGAKVER